MIKPAELASVQNANGVVFTFMTDAQKRILKANRENLQILSRDGDWVKNRCGELIHSNKAYRLDPATRTEAEVIEFALTAGSDGQYRAVDPDGRLSGVSTLAHLAVKRGCKGIVFKDAYGSRSTFDSATPRAGWTPVAVKFQTSAL